MAYGVTPEGFVAKPATVIKAELDEDLKAGPLGASAGTEPDGSIPLRSAAGQLIAILVDGFSGLWEALQAVYSAFDPHEAEDASLDHVCALVGVERLDAVKSSVDATCCGTPTTILQVGRVATVTDTGARFASTVEATITALTAWASGTAYALGDRRTNASRCYECITAGTSAGSGGPTTTAADITDNTAHWKYIGEGTGAVDVPFEAEEAGAIGANAGDLETIATAVSGWSTVTNLEDATLGRLEESNATLRNRREAELGGAGDATAPAIRAAVLAVGENTSTPVLACIVFQNQTLTTDGNGLPGKSVEVLVDRDSDDPDAEIAEAIFNVVGAGIETYGSVSTTVTDEAGNDQTVKYSRPTEVPIYVALEITYDPDVYPEADVDDNGELVKAAIALWGADYPIGKDVRSSLVRGAAAFGATEEGGDPVPGILDVSVCNIGTAPSPVSSATLVIAARSRATFDTSRITVTLTPGTP